MRLISWNVNGLRACLTKGFADYFASCGADAFCLQAVSYTHLGLAVRQLKRHASWVQNVVRPVSYTHLQLNQFNHPPLNIDVHRSVVGSLFSMD